MNEERIKWYLEEKAAIVEEARTVVLGRYLSRIGEQGKMVDRDIIQDSGIQLPLWAISEDSYSVVTVDYWNNEAGRRRTWRARLDRHGTRVL